MVKEFVPSPAYFVTSHSQLAARLYKNFLSISLNGDDHPANVTGMVVTWLLNNGNGIMFGTDELLSNSEEIDSASYFLR